jgi:hypothetical protein
MDELLLQTYFAPEAKCGLLHQMNGTTNEPESFHAHLKEQFYSAY